MLISKKDSLHLQHTLSDHRTANQDIADHFDDTCDWKADDIDAYYAAANRLAIVLYRDFGVYIELHTDAMTGLPY